MVNSLKLIRLTCGFTQKEISDRLNVSRTLVSKWETGSARPDTEQISNLSRVFNLSEEDILNALESVNLDQVSDRCLNSDFTQQLNKLDSSLRAEISDAVNNNNAKLEEFNKSYELERLKFEGILNKFAVVMAVILMISAIIVYGYILLLSYFNRHDLFGEKIEAIHIAESTLDDSSESGL